MTEAPKPLGGDPVYSKGRVSASLVFGLVLFLVVVPVGFLRLLGYFRPLLPWASAPLARLLPCLLLVVAGLALDAAALRAFLDRGRGTQMPFTPTTQLVTDGPFRYLRNPILLGVSVYYLGATALLYGWLPGMAVGAASLLGGGLYYRFFEEPNLERTFGEAYRQYRARTPFLLPLPRTTPRNR